MGRNEVDLVCSSRRRARVVDFENFCTPIQIECFSLGCGEGLILISSSRSWAHKVAKHWFSKPPSLIVVPLSIKGGVVAKPAPQRLVEQDLAKFLTHGLR